MKTFKILCFALIVCIWGSCKKNETIRGQSYVFVKTYSANITVGGVVGITEKVFNVGDTVLGEEKNEGKVTIRIAKHAEFNEGPPSNMSYQEYLDVPSEYLELLKNRDKK